MQEVLKSVVSYNNYMYVTGVQPGGKTGTTNDQYDIWFDGFTPSYAASLWIGTDQNVEMSSMSTVAAHLWAKIMRQIPNATQGQYAPQPENVIQVGGDYYTKGTETGLSSWSSKEEKKKQEEAARKKWQAERENHKKWIDEVGHFKVIRHEAVTHTEDDPSKPIYKTKTVVDKEAWDETLEDGSTVHHDAITHDETELVGYEQRTVIDTPAWDETTTEWVVDKPGHWEYEKGWRDGDFKP